MSVLGLTGLRVENKLKLTYLEVPGTESANAERTLHRYFGVGEIRFGLKAAAAGAGRLGNASNRAASGAGQIAGGLQRSLDAGGRALRATFIVLRALLLAALAVALNLVTVGVAFGVLTLLFTVPSGYPFGGHSYVDAVGVTAIFGVVLGLSIDFAVFLLTRMRERHQQNFDNADAVYFGLERTARVITGAAAIMLAVFVAFAGAPIATISRLGVGLAVAVLVDATVVRIVLLPALMILLGERAWWLPAPLMRLPPELDLHGDWALNSPPEV